MDKWLEDPEQLAQAMELVPILENFTKSVKAAVKAKLGDDVEIPGFKLRKSGNMTIYEAKQVAEQLMDTNLLKWDELLGSMKFSIEQLVPIWAERTEQSVADARKDLKSRLSDIATTKPKAASIARVK